MKTIFTNGCFDILHRGHIELLKFCKSLGGRVVIGLNSDISVRSIKGKDRPINNELDRKFLLESIRYIDEVFIFNEETPLNLIYKIKPDIIVKGGDYTSDNVIGNHLAQVIIYDYIVGYSTSKTIQDLDYR